MLSAGEASGDTYGAQLISSLKQLISPADFFGMGSEKMLAAGCELLVNAKDVAVVGLAEVLTHLPDIHRRFRKMVSEARLRRPAAAVLIDFPDFNLRLAKALHKLGIPVFYFVSPQVWAWRSGRVKQIQKYVRKMIVIFPFEREFYRKHGVDVSYVGHPLAHMPVAQISRAAVAHQWQLDPAKEWIALLPGSRRKEVRMNLAAMVEAAQRLGDGYEYLLPVASTINQEWLRREIAIKGGDVQVKFTDNSRVTLQNARVAVVASGTATVEAALAGTPFVVVYRVAPLTWLTGRWLVKLDTFAMPNLIAGRKIVTELIQHNFTAENVLRELETIIPEGEARQKMIAELGQVREALLDKSSSEEPAWRAAKEILASLDTSVKTY
ncbi:MAG TPA: lipid-A-disaccharide synthase [Candidatus Angelobacter sp.]|jgi:lipid-A-disaccharide synthase|nr:lipid-A-disaccharide synthase [Candidatus Angelobacter sp.]